MNDSWSRSFAMLHSPTVPFVQWPSARCRRVSHGETTEAQATASSSDGPESVMRRALDATDAAILEILRRRPEVAARALAQEHGLSPRTVARRLLHLHALGLVRADSEGLWTAVDSR